MMAPLRRSSIRLAVFFLFYVLYLILGAAVFSAIEGPKESEQVKQLKATKDKFLADSQGCISEEALERFLLMVIEAHKRGVSAAKNMSNEPNWSFGQSFFFAASVLTTIGYGHVTPLSEGGKIFCIVYAAIGIPLTLIFFTASVERLMVITSAILNFLMSTLGHLYRVIYIRLIHLAIIIAFLLVFIFLIPAAIFTLLEDHWNFLDSFYYCFTSLTTIGLGDYIPGEDPHQPHRLIYKLCITVYLFIGLVLMLLMVANIYDVPELNLGQHFYMRSDPLDGEQKRLQGGIRTDQAPKSYTEEVVNKEYQSGGESNKPEDQRCLTED